MQWIYTEHKTASPPKRIFDGDQIRKATDSSYIEVLDKHIVVAIIHLAPGESISLKNETI